MGIEQMKCNKRVEKAKIALVDDSSPEVLFEKIALSKESAYVFYDGAFGVTARAMIHDVTIFDTVSARIDGSITAVVLQDGVKVGEAPIQLPERGENNWINRRECTLVGASLNRCADPDKPCEVQFKYRDLWAIEK